jgi:hypothetical protein
VQEKIRARAVKDVVKRQLEWFAFKPKDPIATGRADRACFDAEPSQRFDHLCCNTRDDRLRP